MENTPPKSPKAQLALKAFRTILLAFILAWTAMLLYNHFTTPDTFLGQKIIYQNEFKTAVEIKMLSETRAVWTECIEETSSIVVTADTAVFKTKHGVIGLKPLYTTEYGGLVCSRSDRALVLLLRINPKGGDSTPALQYLVIAQPEGNIILNPQDICLTEEDIK